MISILLTQNKRAIIDSDDYERVSQFKWSARKVRGRFYAGTGLYLGKIKDKYVTKTIHMHQFILNIAGIDSKKIQVDHINGDGLDNRKSNLRIVTPSQNRRNLQKLKSNNTSGYRGVTKNKKSGLYRARIVNLHGCREHLGYFSNAEQAAVAFDMAAVKFYGQYCGKLNFLN